MNTTDFFRPFWAALFISVAQSHFAFAEVEFVSGGYADQCAHAAEAEGDIQRLPVTGSNLQVDVIEICTRAIQGWDREIEGIAISYNNRGVLYFARENYLRAQADFEAAITKNPNLGQAYLNLGYVLAALERWQESVDALNQGIAFDGDEQARAYFTRGIAHEALENIRAAYEDYLKATELDPEWAEPRRELERFSIQRN